MSRRQTIEMGHDAFLDIVANLVGILIILVVILGSQTQKIQQALLDETETVTDDSSADPVGEIAAASQSQMESLAESMMRSAAAQRESMELEAKVKRYDAQIAAATEQRARLMDLVAIAKQAWESEQTKLDADQVRVAKLQSQIEETASELAMLAGVKEQLVTEKPPVIAVEHLPTPMAKTVFGDEVHFRLKQNRLSLVPIELLLEDIRADLQRSAAGQREGRSIAAVGPIRGYVAHYAMDRSVGRITQNGRTGMGVRVALAGMSIEPLDESVGQPIDEVLQQQSMLDVELAGRDPAGTTITVWVYPDSFAAFRGLKENLYRRGFATAARPLPEDRQITGGPGGTRSQSQ